MRLNSALLAAGAVMALTTGCSHVSADTFFGTDSKTIVMSDNIITYHVKTLPEFSSVEVARGVRVDYQKSDVRHAMIHAGDNVMDSVYCFVNGNTLLVGMHGRNVNYRNTEKLTVTVYGPERLNSVKTSSAGKFVGGNFDGDEMTLKASSSGYIKMDNVVASRLNAHASSSGDIVLAVFDGGRATLHASSSGDVKIDTVKAVSIDGNASSSGDVKVDVYSGSEARLEASSSGRVDVRSVEAVNLEANVSSGGGVKVGTFAGTGVGSSASSGGSVDISKLRAANVNARASSGGSVRLAGRAHTVKASASSGGSIKASGLTADNFDSEKSSGGSINR